VLKADKIVIIEKAASPPKGRTASYSIQSGLPGNLRLAAWERVNGA